MKVSEEVMSTSFDEKRFLKMKKKLQKKMAKSLRRDKKKYIKITPPRYDDVYWEGVKWLDENG